MVSLTEVFSNDSLNRLTGSTLNSVANLSVEYSVNGNITSKSDAGSFDYTTQQAGCSYTGLTAQPHAVRKAGSTVFCYDKNGNMISRGGSTISWTSYNQPNQINAGTNSTQFEYTANHQRWKQTAVDGTGTTTTWYIGGLMEKLSRPGGVIEYRHMIPAGSGTAIYMRKPDGSNATTYLTTDHLGQYNLAAVTQFFGNNQIPGSSVRRMDFDGDGRDDIGAVFVAYNPWGPPVTFFYGYLARGTVLIEGPYLDTSTDTALVAPIRWNDDACTDLQVDTVVKIASCGGSIASTIVLPNAPALFADWDGDGRTDALAKVSGNWTLYRSLGTGVATGVSTGIPASSGQWITLDRDGDGESDLAFSDASASNAIKSSVHNGAATPPDLATTITDGWGVYASPTYVPITQSSNYTKGSTATFPEMDFQGAAYVVSQAAQSDGLGGSFSNTFQYYGARIHRQGRGFEGFAKTRSVDLRNNLVHEVLYNQSFPYIGTVDQDTVYRSDGTTVITRTDSDYLVKTLNDPSDTLGTKCLQTTPLAIDTRCFPYLDLATAESREITVSAPLIQTSVTDYTVDDYGNPTQVTTSTTDKDTASPFYNSVWTSVVANTITNNTTNWCLGKPTRTTTTNTVPGQPVLTRTVDHTVDVVNCRFGTETIEPTVSLLTVVTTFGFDSCGNVNSVSIVGKDRTGATMPARATSSSFGTRCAFPESVTNALSQTATTAYNYSYGVKSSTTDPNAISVSWGYDSFGRRTSQTRPDGTSSTWLYEDCTTASCWGGTIVDNLRLRVTETLYSSAYAVVRTRIKSFDALERQRYESGERVLGVMTTSKVVLDNQGRKLDVYQPYASPHNGYHRYTYDDLNRPTADTLYNSSSTLDRQTLMAYSGLKTTLTDARGNVTQKWTDVAGKLRRIIDPAPGGTTSYEFDAFGNLVQMKDASLAQTDYTYNLRGFKTASSDPDTGNWTYKPNSLNELEEQTDAKLQVTSFGYDKLGRMTSRTEPETPGTPTTWTYGTSAALHNIGRLQSVSKPGGYAESYTFDSLGRPAVSTYTLDGTAYAIDTAYNTLGAVDTVTYPTSSSGYRFTLKYLYSYGFVQQVKDNAAGTIFWSLSSANDYSSPTTEVLGNGATINSGYTAWTNELTSRTEVKNGTTTLQSLAYQWDLNGNLSQRQDLDPLDNLTEVFSNDTLNRLTGSTLNTVANLSVGYAANGNITSKSDAGSYDYSTQQAGCSYTGLTAQPHAVRKAGSVVYCYDKNGNMTSRGGSTISWTSYNQPNLINAGTNSTQFEYTANHQRWKQTAIDGTGTTRTWYIGGLMEKLERPGSVIEYRHMIPAGSGSAIYMRKPDGTNSTTYLTTDHLGSGDLILDSAANVLAKTSFTPFGARRGSNWQGLPTSADYTTFANKTRRGFTGHEMLDAVGLVNVNGRVYDPLIGRFLSADPIIQTINLSQALNPYSYVMNMPLTLIDPSGYSWLSKLWKSFTHSLNPFNGSAGRLLTLGMALPMATDPLVHGAVGAWYSNKATDRLLVAVPALQPVALFAAYYWGGPWGYAAASAHLAQLNGGSTTDAVVAGVTALVGSYLFSYVGSLNLSAWIRIPANGLIAGGVTSANGGSFRDGFLFAVALTVGDEMYTDYVNYRATWASGDGVAKKDLRAPPVEGKINIGTQGNPVGQPGTWGEGGPVSRFANHIPGINAVAGVHDEFVIHLSGLTRDFLNVPLMPIAAALTVPALLAETPGMLVGSSQYFGCTTSGGRRPCIH